jgi:hypothetical protein
LLSETLIAAGVSKVRLTRGTLLELWTEKGESHFLFSSPRPFNLPSTSRLPPIACSLPRGRFLRPCTAEGGKGEGHEQALQLEEGTKFPSLPSVYRQWRQSHLPEKAILSPERLSPFKLTTHRTENSFRVRRSEAREPEILRRPSCSALALSPPLSLLLSFVLMALRRTTSFRVRD